MAKYKVIVKLGKRAQAVDLRLAVIRLRALADRLEQLAKEAVDA